MLTHKIALGTVQFGLNYGISNQQGQTSIQEVGRILEFCELNGINTLDTAFAYGNAEENLGIFNLSSFKIITKFVRINQNDVKEQLYMSMDRMKIDGVYAYLAHKPIEVIENPIIWEELKELKKQNLIKKIGFSINELWELKKIKELSIIPDIVQCPFNYFDKRFQEVLVELKQLGCEIHSRSTFLQGLFLTNPYQLDAYFDSVKKTIYILQQNKNLNGLLLNYVLSKPFIDKVVIGINNTEQLKDNIESLKKIKLPLRELNTEIDESILKPFLWPKKNI